MNLKIPKGSSYAQDDSFWISSLVDARERRQESSNVDEDGFEQPNGGEGFEAPEQFSTTNVMGWVLMKDIVECSPCDVCQERFLSNGVSDTSHALIHEKEYVKGDGKTRLTYPSEEARTVFKHCEEVFQKNEDKVVLKNKVVKRLAKQAYVYVLKKMPQVPTCHLHAMVRRYLNIRTHRFTSLKTSQLMKKTKTSANASKSAKGHSLTKGGNTMV